ncbi:hypothetical protein TWF694_006317 [Orbilia ellipsospora]|uniref:F-box domain-containing protein n=1 Tax=Orbilia ellipsospora TaxID=2528407 RepID=A0AAV9XRG1_9PEZI
MAQVCTQAPLPARTQPLSYEYRPELSHPACTTTPTAISNNSIKPQGRYLIRLPADIVYSICDYLSNADLLTLQLVSSTLRQLLPTHRLDAIHSQKTYFLCQDGIKKLERIARIPSLAKKVTHVTFDLESPYVSLLKRYWCIGTAMRYPQETRFKMQRWYHNHMRRRRVPSRAGRSKDKFRSNTISRILTRLFPLHDIPSRRFKPEKETNYEDAFNEIFTLFEVHLTCLYLQWQSKADILERITSAFRSLPNLHTLEFIRTDITKEDPSVMLSIWRQYNPELAWLLNSNPEIEDGDLPWTDWFSREALHSNLWEAYPSILFCAAQAKRRIREVKVGSLSMEYPRAGAMVSFFEPYHARISDATGGQATREELTEWIGRQVEGYEYTFEGLKRLELCLDEKERESYHTLYWESGVSPLFESTVRNVEELVVWRLESEVRRERSMAFIVPGGMKMEKLRRLEIRRAGVTVAGLVEFMRTNASLREVVCGEDTFTEDIMRKEEVIEVLETMRRDMKLESFEADFLVGYHERRLVDEKKYYLSVKVIGDWNDLAFCEFEIGMKYRYKTADGKSILRSIWVKKHSWEEFTNYIFDADVEEHFSAT